MESKITPLFPTDARYQNLQVELMKVLDAEPFVSIEVGAVIGILEFLKWNLINGC
jgi:hypothetical protein